MNKKVILSLVISVVINILVLLLLSQLVRVDIPQEKNDEHKIKLRYSQLKNDMPQDTTTQYTIEKVDIQPVKQQQQTKVQQQKPKKQKQEKQTTKSVQTPTITTPKEEKEQKIQSLNDYKQAKQTSIQQQEQPPQRSGLAGMLSQKDDSTTQQKSEKGADKLIKELYTPQEYAELSNTQQEFLRESLDEITQWTQYYLNKIGYPQVAVAMRASGVCVVEFYLYPDGYISDVRVIRSSKNSALDENSQFVVQSAFRHYPRPREKTLIRIYVYYRLY